MSSKLVLRELRSLQAATQLRAVVPFGALVQQPPDELRRRAALNQPKTVVLPGKPQVSQHALALVLGFEEMVVFPVGGGDDVMLSIGRLPENDLVIEDPSVSSRHAELLWSKSDGAASIRDLGSTNGTFLNGAQVTDQLATLSDGEVLSLGDVAFVFVTIDSLEGLLRMGTT
jgi:hypothetical protein